MKVCIVGGGNLGHYIAAKLGRNNEIMIFTRNPEIWQSEVISVDENGRECIARNVFATDNPEAALCNAEFIFITWPTNILAEKISSIERFMSAGQWVCFCPGYGGKEFICKKLKDRGVHMIGTQRVFSSTKILERGHLVECIDNRPSIIMSSVDSADLDNGKAILESFFEKKCIALDGYLNISLTPSNPVLHTSRIYSLFADYQDGVYYKEHFAFYSNWSDAASKILINYDDEVQDICAKLKILGVKSLKEHYEISMVSGCNSDIGRMTTKIRSLKFLKDKAPMVKSDLGYIPDLESRYFKEDFTYGLDVLREIATLIGTDHTTMDEIWNWFSALTGKASEQIIRKIGITTEEELLNYYK